MNFKIFLLSVLLLKSCEFLPYCGEEPRIGGLLINECSHVKFLFSNQSTDTIYVWYESVYGDHRHEFGDCSRILPNRLDTIEIASKKATIHQIMNEKQLRNRLDSLFVYSATDNTAYNQWYSRKCENIMEDVSGSFFRFTIVESNIDDVLGAGELIPIYYKGI